jgi:GTPase SAR1 family protein
MSFGTAEPSRIKVAWDWIATTFVNGVRDAVVGPPPRTRQIAFLGTEGCGKTVLIAALAKEIEARLPQGWLLDPRTGNSELYVAGVRQKLAEGDWPPSTPPAELNRLAWTLRAPGDIEAELRVIDFAGQDLRRLFMGELDGIPKELQPLAEYCRSADILVLLINLKDFEGESDFALRTGNELSLKFALDHAQASGDKKYCLVLFTQADQYPNLEQEYGSWGNVGSALLPRLWGAHLQTEGLPIYAVAAVSETETRPDERRVLRKFPARAFKSQGLGPVLDTFQAMLVELLAGERRQAWMYRLRALRFPVLTLLVLWCCFVVLKAGCSTIDGEVKAWTQGPIPVVVADHKARFVKTEYTLYFEAYYRFEQSATIRNDGIDGYVSVVFHFQNWDGSPQVRSEPIRQHLRAGSTAEFSWRPPDRYSLKEFVGERTFVEVLK